MAIKAFKCTDTQALFRGQRVRCWVHVETVAMRKLAMLHRAATLNDLRVPPGNRLEPMQGNRKGQYSIRVNKQWRICFRWTGTDAE